MSSRKPLKRLVGSLTLGTLCALTASCAVTGPEGSGGRIGSASPLVGQRSAGPVAFHPAQPDSPNSRSSAAVDPQEPLEVTLEGAILLALENNRALRVQRLNPPIRETYQEQERAVFDPTIQASVSASRERTQYESGGTETDTTASRLGAGASVSAFLPTGTRVSAGLTAERAWSDRYSDQYATRLGLSVTQALLRGAGLDVNLASVRQARLDTLSSQYELRAFTENLVADVERTYWSCALAQRRIEIFEHSLALAEQQLRETQERINVGALAETELAAAEAEVALRREALINARNDLAGARLRLLRLLGTPTDSMWEREVILKDLPAVPDVKLDDVESHVAVALRMRPDLNQARLSAQRGDLELVKTKNGLLPKMDLFISLGKTGYADSFAGSVQDIGGKSYDVSAALSLQLPVGNRDALARHRRAVLARQQAEEAIGNLTQLAEADVMSAYLEVIRASEQIKATAATRKLQEEKVRVETEKFNVGKSTSLLVAQAQRDLVNSQISEIQAVVNYLNALVELFRLEGSLLERRGISAPGREPASAVPSP